MHKITLDIQKNVFEANARIAGENAELLKAHGVRAFDVLGAIGSGKTTLIERFAELLHPRGLRVGAIAGDVAGDDDYRRFIAKGIAAYNINTGKECHLDAHLVGHALSELPLDEIDVLFIENVGNLVCPADFTVGAEKRIVVVSVTEGDDMLRKHPVIFGLADIAVINKSDLSEVMGVDTNRILSDFAKIKPNGDIVLTNARSGEGLDVVIGYLGL